nr:beta-lactamase family protein [Flavisolibacter sp.]
MKANKIICPIFLCLFVFQLLGTFSFAQSDSSQERFQKILRLKSLVDTLYQDHYNNQNLPGLSYAVMVDEKIAFITGAGYQNIQSKTKVSANSVFRIASMTKSFTALAILKLRDEGKLKLDDASRLYVPEMMDWKHRLSSSPITIRQLLTHMAGFPEDNPWGDRQLSRSEAELSALLISQPAMSNAPGMEFEYSNLGYALLGRIIKNISGQSYQEYISNQILNPLGMHQTYWEVNNVPANQLAQGYRRSGTVYHKEPILPDGSFASMGGMLTTMVDFVKYMQLHMQAWSGGEDSTLFVLKSTLREMHMPHTISGLNTGFQLLSNNTCALVAGYSYGLSWWKDCSNKNYAGHSGGLPGYG